MLRVSLLSAILAVTTAGAAPETILRKFVTSSSPSTSDSATGSGSTQSIGPDAAPLSPTTDLKSMRSTVVHQASDGLFYVDASVNGERVHFVIDTGASVVVLNARDAARTGVGMSTSHVNVDTAGGSSPMKRARIDNISIAGQSINNVSAVVMRDNLKVSLLGQSALAQLDSVAFKGRKLRLN